MTTPRPASRPKRAVLVVCDSLRSDLITPEHTPTLARLSGEWCRFPNHRSVFPSTTRTASASIATGCLPRNHGLLGNVVALDEGQGLAKLSTGKADFRERLRAVTGRVLTRPALAERLAGDGGAVIFSNATPGAAHFQDPDGHGFLYNRAGSHGPGLKLLPPGEHLDTPKGIAGDAHICDRFVEEAVLERRPALSVLWLSEPDFTGHHHPLGSPEHLRAMAAADACVAHVLEAVRRLDPDGREILTLVTSDHGQETTGEIVDVEALLIEAGLKDGPASTELVPASQGTSALIFAAPEARGRLPALCEFLRAQPWAGEVYPEEALPKVGLDGAMSLALAVSMRRSDETNPHGIPGRSDIMFEPGGMNNPGCGQHGGTGPFEQNPFLIVGGRGFPAGGREEPTSVIDIAPTILRHLGQPLDGTDGRPLQDG